MEHYVMLCICAIVRIFRLQNQVLLMHFRTDRMIPVAQLGFEFLCSQRGEYKKTARNFEFKNSVCTIHQQFLILRPKNVSKYVLRQGMER